MKQWTLLKEVALWSELLGDILFLMGVTTCEISLDSVHVRPLWSAQASPFCGWQNVYYYHLYSVDLHCEV